CRVVSWCGISPSTAVPRVGDGMKHESQSRRRGLVQDWTAFVEGKQDRYLVFGTTTSVMRWREKGILRLVHALHPAGQYARRRALDDARGLYLILVAFEQQDDAHALADTVGAAPTADHYPGFASQRGFTLDAAFAKRLRAALRRLGATKQLLPIG